MLLNTREEDPGDINNNYIDIRILLKHNLYNKAQSFYMFLIIIY